MFTGVNGTGSASRYCSGKKSMQSLQASRICGDTFHRVFREFAFCNFKKEDLCLTEPFKCPACTPDMLTISADGKVGRQKSGRADMITMLAIRWNHRKMENLHTTLAKRFFKTTQRAEMEAASLESLKQEFSISVEDVDRQLCLFLFYQEKHSSDSSQEELQREIDEIIYSIRRKKQDLYRQNDSSQTRQRKRRRIGELKKTLSEKIVLYNAIPGCEKKIDTEAACSLCDVILPWEAQGDVVSLRLKRRLFDQVMLVRRLEEEKIIIIKEMTQHYQHLKKVLDKLDRLLGETEEMKIHGCSQWETIKVVPPKATCANLHGQ
ncbi:hypothetical protein ROHU_033475 [Labeo rohita]|uniref:Uncharacterized protein n=1 Tax=Labeo rohita TaxID=84645 RepID=A0A498LAJ4_LABRO|nr:hypothetical protein ROHU_033475 [Labeo rohita]